MKKALLVTTIVSCLTSLSHAEVNISGFGSVVGGKVLSGSGVPGFVGPSFLATYPTVAVYEEEWSFKPDSKFGLQFTSDLTEGLSATAQLVGRGADDFDAGFEWAYLSYELNEHWTLQAGKKRLPLYYYSDFFDVSYAYLWIRPPADNYTWQIFNYTGVNALFNYQVQDWTVSGNIYTGREDDGDNKLLSDYFLKQPVREIWENIIGGVLNLNREWLDLRFTYMTYENRRFVAGVPRQWTPGELVRRGKFMGVSANIDYNNWILLSELNRLTLSNTDFDTYLVSLGYRIGQWTPYVVHSDFDSPAEIHSTTSAGVRWDFHNSAAFKLQLDDVNDDGIPGFEVAGDSKAITFGVDLVF